MANNVAQFRIWDVQHGSACHISTPNGKNIVIDLGVGDISGQDEEFSPLAKLYEEGIRSLDAVLITHPHRDHLDDIGNFDAFNPRQLLRPKHLSEKDIRDANQAEDSDILDKYFEVDAKYSHPVQDIENNFNPENNGGLEFLRFFPKLAAKGNLNNHSIVTVLSYSGLKIIIPGDNESVSWKELLENKAFVTAIKGTDILIAAHHGREAGYSEELFTHISPRLTIISDGPFTDTSATDKYCSKTKGWEVYYANGAKEERKCVTTRTDGTITVQFGYNPGNKPFIHVLTEN
jgi:beta-lactamase superfamily II metal-dependent hydrolase